MYVQYAGVNWEREIWHARMGHPSLDALNKTQRSTNSIHAVMQGIEKLYGGCIKGKQTVTSIPHDQ